METFFSDLLDGFLQPSFLESVQQKFHYEKTRLNELQAVAEQMLPLIQREAFWERKENYSFRGKMAETADAVYEDVAMTLGSGIDGLQEKYHQKGMLSESYMLEVLAWELLIQAYRAYNRYVGEHTKWHVARYHFPGSEEEFPLTKLSRILQGFSEKISCNNAFCLLPKKSVVFVAELTQNQKIQCESICAGCSNNHCPNRMEDASKVGQTIAKTTDLPLTYGYSRIFGKKQK